MKPQSFQKTTKQHAAGLTSALPREGQPRDEQAAQEKHFPAEKSSEKTKKANKRSTHVTGRKRSVNRSENDGCDHLL